MSRTEQSYSCVLSLDLNSTLWGVSRLNRALVRYKVLGAKSPCGSVMQETSNVRETASMASACLRTLSVGTMVDTVEEQVDVDDDVEIYRMRICDEQGGGWISFNSHCNQILLREIRRDEDSSSSSSSSSSGSGVKFLGFGELDDEGHKDLWAERIGLGERVADLLRGKGASNIAKLAICFSEAVDELHPTNDLFLHLEEFFTKRSAVVTRVDCSVAAALTASTTAAIALPSLALFLGSHPTVSIVNTRRYDPSHTNVFPTDFCKRASMIVDGAALGYAFALNHSCNLQAEALQRLSATRRCVRLGRAVAALLPHYLETFGAQPRSVVLQGPLTVGLDSELVSKAMNDHMDPGVEAALAARKVENGVYNVVKKTVSTCEEQIRSHLVGVMEYAHLMEEEKISVIPVKSSALEPGKGIFNGLGTFALFTDE